MQLQTDEEPSELVIPSQWYRFAEGKDALSGFCCHWTAASKRDRPKSLQNENVVV